MSCQHGAIARLFSSSGACPACAADGAVAVRRDAELEAYEADLAGDRARAAALRSQIDDLNGEIWELVDEFGDVEGLLLTLDSLECTSSFAEFVRAAWHVTDPGTTLQWNWHHQLICDVVQGVLEDWITRRRDPAATQRARNVLFGLPPGALKSRILSVFLPAWMWIRCPSWTVLCLSINPKAALRDARLCREVVESPWYQRTFSPAWRLKDDQDALGDYGNTAGGTRLSRGITAETVGLRADLLILDDPNNPKDSESKSARDDIIERWTTTLWNRLNDLLTSLRFIVQQRVHAEDLTGFCLKQEPWSPARPDGWLHVCLPLEYDPERRCVTPWGSDPREVPGESIHPSRLMPDVLRTQCTPYTYEAQYNLRPAAAGGNRFRRVWWRFYAQRPGDDMHPDARPDQCDRTPALQLARRADGSISWDWQCISIDASGGSTEDTASNVAVVVMGGLGPQRAVIEDRTIGPRTYLETCGDAIAAVIAYPEASLLIEDKANGRALKEYVEREAREGRIVGRDGRALTPIIEMYNPSGKGSKQDRAFAIEPDVHAGMVILPDGAPWIVGWIDEFAVFPKGKDDRIDACAQCIDHNRETSHAAMMARMGAVN